MYLVFVGLILIGKLVLTTYRISFVFVCLIGIGALRSGGISLLPLIQCHMVELLAMLMTQ